jgi:hypothetical protein
MVMVERASRCQIEDVIFKIRSHSVRAQNTVIFSRHAIDSSQIILSSSTERDAESKDNKMKIGETLFLLLLGVKEVYRSYSVPCSPTI